MFTYCHYRKTIHRRYHNFTKLSRKSCLDLLSQRCTFPSQPFQKWRQTREIGNFYHKSHLPYILLRSICSVLPRVDRDTDADPHPAPAPVPAQPQQRLIAASPQTYPLNPHSPQPKSPFTPFGLKSFISQLQPQSRATATSLNSAAHPSPPSAYLVSLVPTISNSPWA